MERIDMSATRARELAEELDGMADECESAGFGVRLLIDTNAETVAVTYGLRRED